MTILARLGHQLPAGRRAFSFFSANGRYFKSHSIAAAGPNSSDGRKPPIPGASASSKAKADTTKSTNQDASTTNDAPDANASAGSVEAGATTPTLVQPVAWHAFAPAPPFIHPAPTAQDLRLHQFFSLHRPLLSLSEPGVSVFESAHAPFAPPVWSQSAEPAAPDATANTLDDVPETSPEADVHAARQLARSIVMNRVGATVDFDTTLRRLGLEVNDGRVPVEEMDLSDLAVHLDSTKRKRRKKMKKHKYASFLFTVRCTLLTFVSSGSRSGGGSSGQHG
jgi:hypothetical protein